MFHDQTHLLLISDDATTVETVRATAGALGYAMTHVTDQDAAEVCLVSGSVNLIVCEQRMDGFDTLGFVEKLLFDPMFRHVPSITLVEQSDEAVGVKMRSEFEIVLGRPIDPVRLAAAAATLLERELLFRHLILEDPLTRLLNRQAIENGIKRELNRLSRFQGVGSLVFIDLDDFKQINDRHGHPVGDQTLMFVAGVLKANTREIDLAGRYGGEEFVLYLPESDAGGATIVANRLLEACARGECAPAGIHVTFSAGVAEAPGDGDDFTTLVARADEAMYRAKQLGKNRVETWRSGFDLEQAAEA
jgi:diguanylate cyclase (GGDEF)-like protein